MSYVVLANVDTLPGRDVVVVSPHPTSFPGMLTVLSRHTGKPFAEYLHVGFINDIRLFDIDSTMRLTQIAPGDDYDLLAERLVKLGVLKERPGVAYFEAQEHKMQYWDGEGWSNAATIFWGLMMAYCVYVLISEEGCHYAGQTCLRLSHDCRNIPSFRAKATA